MNELKSYRFSEQNSHLLLHLPVKILKIYSLHFHSAMDLTQSVIFKNTVTNTVVEIYPLSHFREINNNTLFEGKNRFEYSTHVFKNHPIEISFSDTNIDATLIFDWE